MSSHEVDSKTLNVITKAIRGGVNIMGKNISEEYALKVLHEANIKSLRKRYPQYESDYQIEKQEVIGLNSTFFNEVTKQYGYDVSVEIEAIDIGSPSAILAAIQYYCYQTDYLDDFSEAKIIIDYIKSKQINRLTTDMPWGFDCRKQDELKQKLKQKINEEA